MEALNASLYSTRGTLLGLRWRRFAGRQSERDVHLNLRATFTYDNEGRMTGETYPTDDSGTTANLSYTFDSMGRLNTMTDNIASKTLITGASYGPANDC